MNLASLISTVSELMDRTVLGPLADETLAVLASALLLTVAACIAAMVIEEKHHPTRIGKDVTLAR